MCLVESWLVQLIKGALCYSPMIPILDHLIISGINFSEQSCNNKVIRTLVNTQIFSSKVKKRSCLFLRKAWSHLNLRVTFITSKCYKRDN